VTVDADTLAAEAAETATVDADTLAAETAETATVDADTLAAIGRAAGLCAVGVCRAEPFKEVAAVLHERKRAGLHGGMQFTYRNPDRSTDPARLLPGASALIVGALEFEADAGDPPGDGRPHARVAAYARADHYAALRAALEAMAEPLRSAGHRAVVSADANGLVDRAAAHRAAIGWWGKNSNILVPGIGSLVVLGAVVTDAPIAAPDPHTPHVSGHSAPNGAPNIAGRGTPNGEGHGAPNVAGRGTPDGEGRGAPSLAPHGEGHGAPHGEGRGTPNGEGHGAPHGEGRGTPNGEGHGAATDAPTAAGQPRSEVADGCGSCRQCLDGCPTGAITAAGTVDARRCLAWLVQADGVFDPDFRVALGDRIYGCDDCSDVCPPNRVRVRLTRRARSSGGAEPASPLPADGRGAWVSVLDMLDAPDEALMADFGRWYIPRREPRYLRRNALVVLANVGEPSDPRVRAAVDRSLRDDDPLIRAHAVWCARRLGLGLQALSGRDDPLVQAELERPVPRRAAA